MFFAPPKVKSLSRYAEYGAYLGNRHFLVMLVIAMMIHMMVLGVYSLLPSEEVIKIPVRVLNIKLASGGAGGGSLRSPSAPSAAIPEAKAPSNADAETQDVDEELEQMQEESADVAMGSRELPKAPVKPAPVAHAPARPAAKHDKAAHAAKAAHKAAPTVPTSDLTMETPKKFVRVGDAAAGKALKGHGKATGGNDSEVMGDVGGTEIITRYTQTISQWIQNHQIYAKAACGEAAAHGMLCNAKGKVTVRLRIDRNGRIITNKVDLPSGKELIDQAALAMVRASDPVPSVPNNFPETQLEFLIPVQVDLSKQ